jgi:hypothetical protein
MAFLPMDQFVTFEKRFDVSILRANAEAKLHLVETDAILVTTYAFNHCSAHIATKERDRNDFIFIRRGGPEVISMLLKVVILVLLDKESMDLRHISPAFA